MHKNKPNHYIQSRQNILSVQLGFTLIEMIVSIAVLAILVGLAAPSFTDLINRTALNNASNELKLALSLARQTAISNGRTTFICHSNNLDSANPSCDGGNNSNWAKGVLIYNAPDRTAVANNRTYTSGADQLVKQISINAGPIDVASPDVVIAFNSTGTLLNAGNISLTVCNNEIAGETGSLIRISQSGRLSQEEAPANQCP